MPTERSLWSSVVRPALKRVNGIHLIRVENPALPGTPDVNGCVDGTEFWIELKCIDHWPNVADNKPILIEHFTQVQRLWLRKRWLAGGLAWLLLRIDKTQEYLLFTGIDAWDIGVGMTRENMERVAVAGWVGAPPGDELIHFLSVRL